MKVLVVDVGGSQIKIALSDRTKRARLRSGPQLTPDQLVDQVKKETAGWSFDAISIGYPGLVGPDGPTAEPGHLGHGWVGFDFERAFGKPVRIVNDAVMQALGAYDGGRMLFIGLGTGVGSTLISGSVIVPLELGDLPYRSGVRLCDRLGQEGLKEHGHTEWQRAVTEATAALRQAFVADYVVVGGGNAKRLKRLPRGIRRGGNDDAILGGQSLWREAVEHHDRRTLPYWRVV
jgi:polyphosphate glucokinase